MGIKSLLIFLDTKITEPTMYGYFHIFFLIILIAAILLIKFKYNNLSNKQIKKILLVYSLLCIFLEIYKQINFSFNYNAVSTWWSYQWYAFPFQFCSIPMYVALIASLTKNEKIEKAIYTFLGTYGLIAGISVMLYPSTVFTSTLGIDIQTMVHHGGMVFVGALILINHKTEYNFKAFLSGFMVFLIAVICALSIDIITYYVGINDGLEMFFISPYHQSSLPIFNIIYEHVNYCLFLLIYILSFSFGSYIELALLKILNKKKGMLHGKY